MLADAGLRGRMEASARTSGDVQVPQACFPAPTHSSGCGPHRRMAARAFVQECLRACAPSSLPLKGLTVLAHHVGSAAVASCSTRQTPAPPPARSPSFAASSLGSALGLLFNELSVCLPGTDRTQLCPRFCVRRIGESPMLPPWTAAWHTSFHDPTTGTREMRHHSPHIS